MSAMPVMLGVLCVFAIAYRYYSAFLAAKVAVLDAEKTTPAYEHNDGQNFHPTNRWVLFGHHFAAISGAGPLIGPVLAAQFGYLPGLLWIVIGVCLAGAVQDFIVLAASTRRGGRSLAQMAFSEVGKPAGIAATLSILVIIIVAMAGLGKVVVKALGGENVIFPEKSSLVVEARHQPLQRSESGVYTIPAGSSLLWNKGQSSMKFSESFSLKTPTPFAGWANYGSGETATTGIPPGSVRLIPGSTWGTFTIACTIPIALFVGLYMYKLRPGKVIEASLIGAALTLGATFLGGYVAEQPWAKVFNLSANGITWSMAAYGFIASVLPVWVLLCPRDYLSSFLKIGTIIVLVGGVLIANPKMEAPAINHVFAGGGPIIPGTLFPFLFITVMCGAISGFHSLVSSGTTPKMIKNERDARTIGYGAMLIEGLVGVTAMIAAATLPTNDYYGMNTDLAAVTDWHDRILQVGGGVEHAGDNLALYESRTQESLRGRTGGAVTLAVGMAHIFDGLAQQIGVTAQHTLATLWKYWYHFAIMFEALFILTTIDTGTRIGRFLLQEVTGRIHPSLGIQGGWLSATLSTAIIVLSWVWFLNSDSFAIVWQIFGISNQMLGVIALGIATVYLSNEKRRKYIWVTVIPMCFVATTTTTAAVKMISAQVLTIQAQLAKQTPNWKIVTNNSLQATLIAAMLICTAIVLFTGLIRIWPPREKVVSGFEPVLTNN